MIARSRAHLHGAGEDYRQHFRFATKFGLLAMAAGIAALVHARMAVEWMLGDVEQARAAA